MNKLALYCKSYSKDLARCNRLVASVIVHNKDKIPFYISVPKEDIALFKSTLETNEYILIADEDILGENLSQSWNNQQIVKMTFNISMNVENAIILDSDCYFIRDFYIKDFIMDLENNIPLTICHEQHDLFEWTSKNKHLLGFDPKISFGECRYPIMDIFNRKGKLLDGGPVPCIFNKKIWESMKEEYLIPNNLTFNNLIETIPSEFTYYLEWVLTHPNIIPLYPSEPLFKCLHFLPQYYEYKNNGWTEDHFKENYLGLVLQSSSGLPLKY
jgi:hypothetical protein